VAARSWTEDAAGREQGFLAGRPSRTFIVWIRRVLLAWWIALLVLDGPDVVHRFNQIRAANIPSVDRSSALQRLCVDAAVELLAFPGLLVAMLGYGIAPDRTSMVSGGPWFRLWWSTSSRVKQLPGRVRANRRQNML